MKKCVKFVISKNELTVIGRGAITKRNIRLLRLLMSRTLSVYLNVIKMHKTQHFGDRIGLCLEGKILRPTWLGPKRKATLWKNKLFNFLLLLVIVQPDAQIPLNIFIYSSLHVSSMSRSSSGETDCINTASGKCHSVLVAVSCAGWE